MTDEARTGRSWGATLLWFLLAGVLAGAAYMAAQWALSAGATLGDGGWKALVGWPLTAALALGSVICVVGIFTASGAASCPSCGAAITAFDATRPDRGLGLYCPGCETYCIVRSGQTEALADDHVHPRPFFATVFQGTKPSQGVTWCGCVVCGAAPTRERLHELQESQHLKNVAKSALGVAMTVAGGSGSIETGGGKVWSIPVPYCDAHDQGVAFRADFGTPIIQFRSLRAFRTFCAANGTTPRDVPDDLPPEAARSKAVE